MINQRTGMTKRIFIIVLLGLCAGMARAQEQELERDLPLRSYRPEEVVSFNPNIPFNTVIEILNGMCQRFENRIIIDSKVRTRPIGVSVENMYWKRALEYILRSNMLKYTQHDRYYEIEDLLNTKEPPVQKSEFNVNTPEVEINAVFFQADYQTLMELGIDWTTFRNGTVRAQVQAQGASQVSNNFLNATVSGTINRTLNVTALLRAFESASKGEVIARPQIRVADGKKGRIKVGRNFYLTTTDFAGNLRFSEYEAGIILAVTPTVVGKRDSTFIHLSINAERSDVQLANTNTTKNITEGSTQVLLLDGEQTAIAGLISDERQQVRRGVPILKDLPPWFFGLRYLFGYESTVHSKRELIILLGARIVPKLMNRRTLRRDVQDALDEQKRELRRAQPNGNSYEPTPRESATRKTRPTSQKNR